MKSEPENEPVTDGRSGLGSATISVLMPVYNAEVTLGASLSSALCQLRPPEEVIVIDDGSSDGSAAILSAQSDRRIKVYSQPNAGLAVTLNRGIYLASGRYIARLDNDDLALPARFERQAAFMDAHPEVAVVGTWAEIYSGDRPSGRFHRHPSEPARLRLDLLFDNPFVHSSVMFRAEVIRSLGGYRVEGNRFPEDYDLWSRVANHHDVANLPEVLTIYREMPGSMMRSGGDEILRNVALISSRNLHSVLPHATESECAGLTALYHGMRETPVPMLPRALQLWHSAARAVGGPRSAWSAQFREGYAKARRHLIAQYFRRILPRGMLEGLRAVKRRLVNRS